MPSGAATCDAYHDQDAKQSSTSSTYASTDWRGHGICCYPSPWASRSRRQETVRWRYFHHSSDAGSSYTETESANELQTKNSNSMPPSRATAACARLYDDPSQTSAPTSS
eukprot:688602-Pyramimonas_sp.AAC.1